MTKSAETAVEIEICARCGLPIEGEASKHCSCGFPSREQNAAETSTECDEWADVT